MQQNRAPRPHPSTSSNCLARLLLWWVGGLFKHGYHSGLEDIDLYDVLPEDSSTHLANKLGSEWEKELQKWRTGGHPRLWLAVARCYGSNVAAMGFLLLLQESLRIIQVFFIGELVAYFMGAVSDSRVAYIYAAALSVSYIIITLLSHPTFHTNYMLGMKMRVACTSLMYRKALHLSSHSVLNTPLESIMKLMGQDVQKLDQSLFALHYLWLGFLSLAAVCTYLYYTLQSPAFVAGILVICLLVLPLQAGMTKLFAALRLKISVSTNTRIKVLHEVLKSVRSIKIYCWESMFCQIVHRLREDEVKKISSVALGRAFQLSYFFSYNKLVTFGTFACIYLLDGTIDIKKVCVTMALFDVLKVSVVLMIPLGVFYYTQAMHTIRKVQDFLLLEEKNHEVYSSWGDKLPGDVVVQFENFSAFPAASDKVSYAASLQALNFSIIKGHLIVIVGPPGSGKTPLLMAMLGEIPRLRGFLRLKGRLSYASQLPWVFTASVRDNILFGAEYDRARYNKVVKACDLSKDIEVMPHSDMTIVGEHGYELVLGQKIKISLARSIYRQAEIYLLDDPFGAVDSYVGRTIFNKCVCGMLKESTVVLVTQQLPYVKVADLVLIMQDGNITSQGMYEELVAAGVDFSKLLGEYEVERTPTIEASLASTPGISKTKRRVCGSQQLSIESLNTSLVSVTMDANEVKSLHSLLLSDKSGQRRADTGVPWSVYSELIQLLGGWCMIVTIGMLWLAAVASYAISDWFIVYWADKREMLSVLDNKGYFFVYIALSIICVVLALLTGVVYFLASLMASKRLHTNLFQAVIRAPLSELQREPVNEILRRFTQDVVQLDDLLPVTAFDALMNSGTIAAALVLSCAGNYWMGLAVLPLAIFFLFTRYFYCQSARDIKKLEQSARFPVFNHLSTSLEGLWTIRALDSEERFLNSFDTLQDRHTAAAYTYIATNRWFALLCDTFCIVFIVLLAIISIVTSTNPVTERGEIQKTCICLALVYAVNLVWTFQTTVRNTVEVDCQMSSVQRVLEYSQLKPETFSGTTASTSIDSVPEKWPTYGIITFESVSLTYPDSGVKALRNVYCCFRAYEKVGVVGRMGAGKHSMVAAILRLYEPQGIVRIDGIDTATLTLKELRENIAVVPEDAPLFSGNLRQNLDFNGKSSDAELWAVLEEVNLKHKVESLPGRLYADMAHLLPHLTVGQKQLVCLARVLLKPSTKILIIEETLDNVDPRSAALLQKIVKRNFEHCTVITIARRLKTVIDADRIMVMENGKIKELDPPHILLQNEKGVFYNLVKQRGTQEANLLREIARHKYENKPYVAPAMKEADALGKVVHNGPSKNPGYYIPAFQSSRLTAAFNHLLPNKEANKYQRKF